MFPRRASILSAVAALALGVGAAIWFAGGETAPPPLPDPPVTVLKLPDPPVPEPAVASMRFWGTLAPPGSEVYQETIKASPNAVITAKLELLPPSGERFAESTVAHLVLRGYPQPGTWVEDEWHRLGADPADGSRARTGSFHGLERGDDGVYRSNMEIELSGGGPIPDEYDLFLGLRLLAAGHTPTMVRLAPVELLGEWVPPEERAENDEGAEPAGEAD
jgi:hypothetical protein